MEKREGVKRVLITSIGGGNYEKDGVKYLKEYNKTVYEINGEKSKVTTYMPKVVEEEFEVDKTIIIGTTGTMWDNVYKEYCKKNDEKIDRNYVRDLRETERISDRDTDIKELNISKLNEEFVNKVRGIVIKYGLNREEIFENFDSIIKLEEEFNDEDEYEVILDITHSFRSTAFWMFLVMTYLTDVSNKKIKIIEVTYGMYEAKKVKTDPAPIILLNSFLEILNWIKGASELKQYGNTYYILENLNDTNDIPKDVKNELENFSNAMNMNYVGSLLESLKNLADLEKKKEIDNIKGPAKHIIPGILKNFINDFNINESNDERKKYLLQATLAKWHCEQKRYAMAAININEALANFISNSLDFNKKDTNTNALDPNSKAKNWLRELYKLKNVKEEYEIYGKIYNDTIRIRNEIAHSLGNEVKILYDINLLKEFSEKIMGLLKDENIIKKAQKELKLLENISNKKTNKMKTIENNSLSPKSILILSTRALNQSENNELNKKLKLDKIHTLEENDIKKWKNGSEEDIDDLKKVICKYLKEGDYILIHGYFLSMQKIASFAISKGLKAIFLSEKFSSKDEYFKEI
ncbi:TIGR02221 family CRISPR-associated protein [Fusobacterium polymorphum]|jgi:CRISPR-associated protein, TM1812 family|uniref:CRISPR-associated protein n=2 Tax=Fusobacterium TaxID=848 RepID=A0A241Q139_FUSNP|nr:MULTISPECIES: TIGR02221 family CRISPR-associated protein [Fusobacterium]ASG28460.1 CRISPR-associated protein [Fusobacterium polymorphum]ETZ30600.1 tm1812 family CRISPR-associated protein [Fusobacterium nucleatum 13_3C]